MVHTIFKKLNIYIIIIVCILHIYYLDWWLADFEKKSLITASPSKTKKNYSTIQHLHIYYDYIKLDRNLYTRHVEIFGSINEFLQKSTLGLHDFYFNN